MTINDLKKGESGKVTSVGGDGALRQHLLDMGVIPGVIVSVEKFAPMGDPVEISVHGYELTLRLSDAKNIEIIPNTDKINTDAHDFTVNDVSEEHPGLGESGKYHIKSEETPVHDGTILSFALVGNQNCGKTTLFNQLTGSNQHVGNFPGVTVDRKDASIKGYPSTIVTDLPGIYSMSPYSSEEIVSRNFVIDEKPNAIINIIDATNIERNLYLTMQLLEMNIPMVVALNMMDEFDGNGGSIDINGMESLLGVPVVPISAAKNQGIKELTDHALHVAYYQEKPIRQDFCNENDHSGAVHRCLHAVIHLIEDHALNAHIPVRFAASKVVEGDKLIIDRLNLDENELDLLDHIIVQVENDCSLDRSAVIADMRYDYILRVCKNTVKKPHESKERVRSKKIDKFLTGKYTAIPAFIVIMLSVFILTFNIIGPIFQGMIENGITHLTNAVDVGLRNADANQVIRSLIVDGIFKGVGTVLSFCPIIIILFFFLSILEDSGYIARVAFFMDKLLRKIGLSGRSIVPLLIGFGCTVPAVMSTRTLPSERDRKMTILLTPFMSCSAKMPVYAFFAAAFFPDISGLVMGIMYFAGIVIGILNAFLYKKTIFKGEAVPFVMELPNYRLPSAKNVGKLLWDKFMDFIKKAFTVIFVATVIVWALQSFDIRFNYLNSPDEASLLAMISGILLPIFRPIGLGNWKICTSLICGVLAKESIVSTLQVLFPEGITSALSTASALSLMTFSLLYTPCVAAIASIRKELGIKWSAALVIWQCAVAWIFAFIVYFVAGAIV